MKINSTRHQNNQRYYDHQNQEYYNTQRNNFNTIKTYNNHREVYITKNQRKQSEQFRKNKSKKYYKCYQCMNVSEICQSKHKIKNNDQMLLNEYYTAIPTRNSQINSNIKTQDKKQNIRQNAGKIMKNPIFINKNSKQKKILTPQKSIFSRLRSISESQLNISTIKKSNPYLIQYYQYCVPSKQKQNKKQKNKLVMKKQIALGQNGIWKSQTKSKKKDFGIYIYRGQDYYQIDINYKKKHHKQEKEKLKNQYKTKKQIQTKPNKGNIIFYQDALQNNRKRYKSVSVCTSTNDLSYVPANPCQQIIRNSNQVLNSLQEQFNVKKSIENQNFQGEGICLNKNKKTCLSQQALLQQVQYLRNLALRLYNQKQQLQKKIPKFVQQKHQQTKVINN